MTQKLSFCFAQWMAAQPMGGALVNAERVVSEWAVDRATAYRWLNNYREALRWANKYLAK